jgi:adenylate cyclase
MAIRRLYRKAGRRGGEQLREEDWAALWGMQEELVPRMFRRTWSALPGSPRCGICAAPFEGLGSRISRPLGYRPSRKNPSICSTCVESSPPGGMAMNVGVLFADLRGFTSHSEGMDPSEVTALLRRFYGCAERVLFPEAVIDKLIGDEVMALYLQPFVSRFTEEIPAALMIDHARELLRAVGYGTPDGPFVELGIGIDYGEAFVGNIGDRAVYDFTAVGDVVNTASRLQGQAAGGEAIISAAATVDLAEPPGDRIELVLKGKSGDQPAYRFGV